MSDSDSGSNSSVFEAFLANTINKNANSLLQSKGTGTYKEEWEQDFQWLEPHPKFKNSANCKWCKARISITSFGIEAVKRHEVGKRHQHFVQNLKNDFDRKKDMASDSDDKDCNEKSNMFFKYVYESKWKLQYNFLNPASKLSLAKCTLCNVEFSIGYRGIHDVKRHMFQQRHSRAVKNTQNGDIYSPQFTYDSKWEAKYGWVRAGKDTHSAFCTACEIEFSIEFGGKYNVIRHARSVQHRHRFNTFRKNKRTNEKNDSDSSINLKKRKTSSSMHFQRYNPAWEQQHKWIEKCNASDVNAWCTICLRSFSIAYRGLGDVNRHANQIKHKNNAIQRGISKFQVIKNESESSSSDCSNKSLPVAKIQQVYIKNIIDDHAKQKEPSSPEKSKNIPKFQIISNVKLSNNVNNKELTDDHIDETETMLPIITEAETTNQTEEYVDYSSALYWNSFMKDSSLHQQQDEDSVDSIPMGTEPIPNTQIRYIKYNTAWEQTFNWIAASAKTEYEVECKICNVLFSIKYRGLGDIKRHQTQRRHAYNAAKLPPTWLNRGHDVHMRSTEIAYVFHTICCEEYLKKSSNCVQHLFARWFPESPTATQFSCPRKKYNTIIADIILPLAQQQITSDLGDNHYFSILTDTSQANSIGACPLLIRYYRYNQGGVRTKLLTFFTPTTSASSSLAADDTYVALNQQLEIFGLCIANCTAFVANNSKLNYGTDGVFSKLLLLNGNMLSIKCVCRAIHTAARRAQNIFKFDIEQIVYKCYTEILSVDQDDLPTNLMDLLKWLQTEWHEIWKNIPNRWLNIVRAAHQLLIHYKTLQLYFRRAEIPSSILCTFFECEIAECYLSLFVNVCEILRETCIFIETTEQASVIDLHKTMEKLHDALEIQCSNNNLYESVCSSHNTQLIQKFRNDALEFYATIVNYIENDYDFESKTFEFLEPMRLTQKPMLCKFEIMIEKLGLTEINTNGLYKELRLLGIYYDSNVPNELLNSTALIEWWTKYLLVYTSPNLLKICNFVFSLPLSNIASDRLCNTLNVDLKQSSHTNGNQVTSELIIKEHFCNINCQEFSDFLDKTDIATI